MSYIICITSESFTGEGYSFALSQSGSRYFFRRSIWILISDMRTTWSSTITLLICSISLDLFDFKRKEAEPVFWSTFFMDKSVTYLALLLWALQLELLRFFLLLNTLLTRV